MKNSCEVIKDLLPIYADGVCSKESAAMVEEHLSECEPCSSYLKEIKATEAVAAQNATFTEAQQLDYLKFVKKKMRRRTILIAIAAVIGSFAVAAIVYVTVVVGLLSFSVRTAATETYTNVQEYSELFGENAKDDFKSKWDMDESIFPESVDDVRAVKEFSLTYYNPWDAQYVGYLTVEYSDADYEKELTRLKAKGIDEYTGFYSVKGEPSAYSVVAMEADSYQGFVYALVPKTDNEENTVTYVEIIFCNYFLDLDINEYLPHKYLLKGFDASKDNPYAEEKRAELEKEAWSFA